MNDSNTIWKTFIIPTKNAEFTPSSEFVLFDTFI